MFTIVLMFVCFQGIVDCYLGLDQPYLALRLASDHKYEQDMLELSAEPLWRLGLYQDLEELCNKNIVS